MSGKHARPVYAVDLDLASLARLQQFRASFPIVSTSDHWTDHVVTEGHAETCRVFGHATYTVDGVVQGICPRCGESTVADDEPTFTVCPVPGHGPDCEGWS